MFAACCFQWICPILATRSPLASGYLILTSRLQRPCQRRHRIHRLQVSPQYEPQSRTPAHLSSAQLSHPRPVFQPLFSKIVQKRCYLISEGLSATATYFTLNHMSPHIFAILHSDFIQPSLRWQWRQSSFAVANSKRRRCTIETLVFTACVGCVLLRSKLRGMGKSAGLEKYR